VLDASGGYGGGLFNGYNLRLNSEYCETLSNEFSKLIADNKTFNNNQTEVVPFYVQNIVAKYEAFIKLSVS
jgi:hypothetical protein